MNLSNEIITSINAQTMQPMRLIDELLFKRMHVIYSFLFAFEILVFNFLLTVMMLLS